MNNTIRIVLVVLFIALAYIGYIYYHKRRQYTTTHGAHDADGNTMLDGDTGMEQLDDARDDIVSELTQTLDDNIKIVIEKKVEMYPESNILMDSLLDVGNRAVDSVDSVVRHVPEGVITQILKEKISRDIMTHVRPEIDVVFSDYESDIKTARDRMSSILWIQAQRSFGDIVNLGRVTLDQVTCYMSAIVKTKINGIILRIVKTTPDLVVTKATEVANKEVRNIEQFVWSIYNTDEGNICKTVGGECDYPVIKMEMNDNIVFASL